MEKISFKTMLKNKKWISYILFGLAGVMAILAVLTYLQIKSCEPKDRAIDTAEDVMDYLRENSNLFDVLEEQKDFWPEETLVLDLQKKCVIHTAPNLSDTIKYEDIKKQPACKKIADQVSKDNFRKMPDQFITLINDTTIEKEINAYIETYTSADKDTILRFSRLYNALAGDTLRHIVLGKKNNQWHLYRMEDFPEYTLSPNVEKYREYILYHKANHNDTLKNFLQKQSILSKRSIFTVYYDFRHDRVFEQDDVIVMEKDFSSLQNDLNKIKVQSGWLNTFNKQDKKWELISAQDYYQNPQAHFVKTPEDNWMVQVEWTDKTPLPSWLVLVLGVLTIVLLGAGGGLWKLCSNEVKEEQEPVDEPVLPDLPIDENRKIAVLEKQIKEIEEKLKKANNKIVDLENDKAEEVSKLHSDHQKVIEKLKEQHKQEISKIDKDHADEIVKAKKDAIEQYRRDNKIEVIGEKADQWDELIKISKSDKLLQRLEELHKKYPQFAEIETIRSTYQKAAQKSKDYREQVLFIFRELREQVDKNLQWENTFNQLCTDADYANKVRDRYEVVRKQVDAMQRNPALIKITQKDSLDFLERVALCTWSLNAMNDLLAAFQCKALPAAVVSKVQSDVVANLLQLFTARLFLEAFTNNESLAVYKQNRENTIINRINRLKSDYNIIVSNDVVAEIASNFDDAMDQIHSTDEYVNRMWKYFVEDFYKKADSNTDKGWFFGMMVAMGYHSVDFVRRKHGIPESLCPNYTYLLSNLNNAQLPSDSAFSYHDFAHSVDYSNRVYEWLTEMNVKELKALVGRHLILP